MHTFLRQSNYSAKSQNPVVIFLPQDDLREIHGRAVYREYIVLSTAEGESLVTNGKHNKFTALGRKTKK